MESLLHYTWKHRLFPLTPLTTTDGRHVEVIDPGMENRNDGPDFFNAKVKIDGTLWVGNVEIHVNASDWYLHGHDTDRRYDSVVLHERLDQRAELIAARYEAHDKNWDDALFCTLVRNFGFGTNGEAFDEWARRIDFRAVDKHADSLLQVEAFFFGQAGLLDEATVPAYYHDALHEDTYFQALKREYAFLAHKFSLRPMEATMWRLLGMRPANFPHVRLAQLASLYHERRISVSKLLAATDKAAITALLRVEASSYWNTHYTFASTPSVPMKTRVTDSAVTLLLINSVAPFYYSYGRRKDSERYCEQAIALLEQLKAENNYIIRTWTDCGLLVKNAADSQALIQLKKQYCDRRDCLRCRIGYEFLKREYGVDKS